MEATSLELPPSPRYHVPAMQGEARMCQEVADFMKTVHPNGKGIRIAGIYGMAGQGKTTLTKAFCNHKWGDFDGKVCYLEFSRGNKLDRLKLILHCLIDCRDSQLEWVTSEDEAHYLFNTLLEGQRVLLVLDNIMDADIEEVRYYLGADFGENSYILLTAQRKDALNRKTNFNIDSQSCMRVPSLTDEEAIAILLESTFPEESAFGVEDRLFALRCANRCSFTEETGFAPTFHPLALKTFGRHLISKHRWDLSYCVPEIHGFEDGTRDDLDDVFSVLEKAFDDMDPKHRNIIMLLTVDELQKHSSQKVVEWLAIYCNNDINYIKEAVEDLWKYGFIEKTEHQIRIHELIDEIAQNKIKNAKQEDDETGTHCIGRRNIERACRGASVSGGGTNEGKDGDLDGDDYFTLHLGFYLPSLGAIMLFLKVDAKEFFS
ncbi:hypothetical protein SUGI_0874320 [Cryptomeria japonica]|nr:hypothetical protein SUGI_0874320 [Cryptomeria japonica]